jgi:hypothetical protein
MSNRNPYDGYPGRPYPPPGLTEEAQFFGLGPRLGDSELQPATQGRPWGRVVALGFPNPATGVQPSITPIATEVFPQPIPFALRVRFSLTAEGPFTAAVPSSYSGRVNVRVIESLDAKSGPAVEAFILNAGATMSQCVFIARSISVTLTAGVVGEDGPPPIYVQIVACPVQQIDCDEVTGQRGAARATITRVDAELTPTTLLAANPARKGFLICNHSPSGTLFVALGQFAALEPDSAFSFLLPPNTQYSSGDGGFTGLVTGIWDAIDDGGEALVTEET